MTTIADRLWKVRDLLESTAVVAVPPEEMRRRLDQISAELPDPDAVEGFIEKAKDLRDAGMMMKTHDLAMAEDFVISDPSYVEDLDAALAKLEKP